MDEDVPMCDAALFLVSLGAIATGQDTQDQDPSDLAYDHFRDRYELYSTIGDFNAEEFRTVTRLSLAGTEFGDGDVPHLAGLVSLQKIDLTGTLVTDEGMKALGQLEIPLETLILADTKITNKGLFKLAYLATLRELDISGTGVTSKGIVQLPRFHGRLTDLTVGKGITDAGMRAIPALEGLERLRVPVDGLTPEGFRLITRSESLRSLELYGEGLTREKMRFVASMPFIERLVVSGFPELDDSFLDDIGMMRSLRALDVSRTSITNAALKKIATVPNLEELSLSFTAVTDSGMKVLGDMVWSEEGEDFALKTATNITHLELASTAITDRGLHHLAALQLTSLDVSRSEVTNGCRETIEGWKLKNLVIEGQTGLSDLSIVESLPELERLDVSDRKGVNRQIRSLSGHPSLAVLDLSNTDILDSSMRPLTKCEALRQLNIAGTRISADTLEVFARLGRIELVNVFSTDILVYGEERRESLPGLTLSRLEAFPAFED